MIKKILLPFIISLFLLSILLFVVLRPKVGSVLASGDGTTINVNTTADVISNDGHCSLREAIIAANTDTQSGAAYGECSAGSGADTINVPAGTYSLTLSGWPDTPAIGDLDITSQLTILGATTDEKTKIDANHIVRAIEISTTGKATISYLWIQGGEDSGFMGGGIKNQGMLTLTNGLVIANYSSTGGGGLYNGSSGEATLSDVSFGNNKSYNGGGIYNIGIITLTNVSLDFGTEVSYGGGLFNFGTANLRDVNISANTAANNGGGIYNAGILTATRVTVNDNAATGGNGGGIWNAGTIKLENTTISTNTANNGLGGGFYQGGGSGTMTNVTIADNSAGFGGGIWANASDLSIKNTLLANNSGGNCRIGTITLNPSGYNLSDDNTCNSYLNQTGDQNNIPAKIGVLKNNGGSTETHALLAGSPAIDHGDNSGCPATDQREYARPVDGDLDGTATCDVGAYEKWLEIFLPLVMR